MGGLGVYWRRPIAFGRGTIRRTKWMRIQKRECVSSGRTFLFRLESLGSQSLR